MDKLSNWFTLAGIGSIILGSITKESDPLWVGLILILVGNLYFRKLPS